MDIFVLSKYSSISKESETFCIKNKDAKQIISPLKVDSILISQKCSISTDAILLASEYDIDIVVLNDFGDPVGRFWHCKFGSTANIRKAQLILFNDKIGIEIAKEIIIDKIDTSIKHLKRLAFKRREEFEKINNCIKGLEFYKNKINLLTNNDDITKAKLRAYEGNAGRIYYSKISSLLPEEYKFKSRTTKNANDPYNALLNYGFGILYSKVEKSCIIAGLDPYIGILHTDNYGKKSLGYDMIERHRHLAWETVFSLFSRKLVNQSHFTKEKDGIKLSKEGKALIANSLGEKLIKKTKYKDRMVQNKNVLDFRCQELSSRLIDLMSSREV